MARLQCPKHGFVRPCDGWHPDGSRRLCDPSLLHCSHNNCAKQLQERKVR